MNAVQPLFFINILVGFTLALCLAYVAWGRERDLTVWAAAFALYPIAFVLFGFRAYFPEWVPVILANSCLAVMFSSFTFLARAILMATGKGSMVGLIQPGVPQTILLSLAMVWLIMFALGLLVKYKERAEGEMMRLALHDPLTQLGNRRVLHDRLALAFEQSRREGLHGAFLVLDLDHFKELNDTHGHALGDQLLVEVAYRLKDCVNDCDTVIRLGGDEFVLLVVSLDRDEALALRKAQTIAHRIRETLQQPYRLQMHATDAGSSGRIHYHLSVSIGGDLFQGHDKSRETLFRNADGAMYLAKESGKNCVVFHGAAPLAISGVA